MREEYFLYVEDVDFCYRTLKQGFKMYVNLASKIYHKVSTSTKNSDGVSPLQVYYLTRNRLCFMLKIQESKFNKLIFLGFFISTRAIRILEWLLKGKLENIMSLIKAIKDFRQL